MQAKYFQCFASQAAIKIKIANHRTIDFQNFSILVFSPSFEWFMIEMKTAAPAGKKIKMKGQRGRIDCNSKEVTHYGFGSG